MCEGFHSSRHLISTSEPLNKVEKHQIGISQFEVYRGVAWYEPDQRFEVNGSYGSEVLWNVAYKLGGIKDEDRMPMRYGEEGS